MKRSSTTVIFITPWANITLKEKGTLKLLLKFFLAKSPLGTVGDDLGTVDCGAQGLYAFGMIKSVSMFSSTISSL